MIEPERVDFMICLRGFNTKLEELVYLIVYDDGMITNENWNNIQHGSIKRYTELLDKNKKLIWEDDELINEKNGKHVFVRFGEYEFVDADGEELRNIGFHLENEDFTISPIGTLEDMRIIGDSNSI